MLEVLQHIGIGPIITIKMAAQILYIMNDFEDKKRHSLQLRSVLSFSLIPLAFLKNYPANGTFKFFIIKKGLNSEMEFTKLCSNE